MRTILAVVPGIKSTGMVVYGESPTRILTRDKTPMSWAVQVLTASTRPHGISAKAAILIHTAKAYKLLMERYPDIGEVWIEGRLDESTGRMVVPSKSDRRRVALVGAFLGLPAALQLRQRSLSTVLVEPGEWREWAFEEGGKGTLQDNIEALVGFHTDLHENTLYALALGMYAGTFSKDTSKQPKSAKLPERE